MNEEAHQGGETRGDQGRARELEQAEQRGADRVRQRLRRAVEEHRRVVRVGDLQVEVVEVAAIDDVLRD